ncbi:CopL family metal-binding regulatory protein [Pseudoxanthomonas sp. z9]|uniref:CopL family metal-binding regulatory protein n=1 Tax=Pseudoxanthomonas sp. z9 TaxID=2584942 RepID=UPI0015E8BFE5|nr:CopL family metal-binding regulatory protein [Pseudoxanthomonas sp. z9]MCL6713191.1 CopL family metal-binding regulatory protein [Pseudomonas sp. R2.Fl]
MSLATLLMRCLLCVALVLNGASAAAASVRMLDMGSGAQAASGERGDAHDLDCAGHASEPEDKGSPSGRDCCKSASCPCACVQGCATAMDTPTDTPVIIVHAGVVPTPVLEHPAPALPHLIRPPIG